MTHLTLSYLIANPDGEEKLVTAIDLFPTM